MTRLIDADLLKLEIACVYGSNPQYINWLNHAPTVDAVPVIRCKDCKYCSVDRYADGNVPDYVCIEMDCGVEADGFCAWAERKE